MFPTGIAGYVTNLSGHNSVFLRIARIDRVLADLDQQALWETIYG